VTLSVRVEPLAAAAAQLTIVVADGGRGMSAEECAHAFEPYYRAPSHRGGGTGLGLYVCKRLSEAMGGSVVVRSALGQGATFTVQVPLELLPHERDDGERGGAAARVSAGGEAASESTPLSRVPQAAEPASLPPPPLMLHAAAGGLAALDLLDSPAAGGGAQSHARYRKRVLLADDHNLNLRLCKRLLEAKAAMEVVTVDDGDVALQWLISSYQPGGPPPVDLVLMDSACPLLAVASALVLTSIPRILRSEHAAHGWPGGDAPVPALGERAPAARAATAHRSADCQRVR